MTENFHKIGISVDENTRLYGRFHDFFSPIRSDQVITQETKRYRWYVMLLTAFMHPILYRCLC